MSSVVQPTKLYTTSSNKEVVNADKPRQGWKCIVTPMLSTSRQQKKISSATFELMSVTLYRSVKMNITLSTKITWPMFSADMNTEGSQVLVHI